MTAKIFLLAIGICAAILCVAYTSIDIINKTINAKVERRLKEKESEQKKILASAEEPINDKPTSFVEITFKFKTFDEANQMANIICEYLRCATLNYPDKVYVDFCDDTCVKIIVQDNTLMQTKMAIIGTYAYNKIILQRL